MAKRKRKTKAEAAAVEPRVTLPPDVQLKAVVGPVVRTVAGRRVAVTEEIRAPIAEPAEWDDPADRNIRSKAPHQVRGVRRADPLLNLHQRSPREVTARHVRCAEQLRDDFEMSQGAVPPRDIERLRGSGGPSEGPTARQLLALESYRRALQAVGMSLAKALAFVVLAGQTVAEFAARNGLSAEMAKGYLVAALDRLADHYEPAISGTEGRRTPRAEKSARSGLLH